MNVYIDNFKTIFGLKNNIQSLRNKVLELAIQGKLVEQDLNEEPASEFMNMIQIKKDKLTKEGKMKKTKNLKAISETEIPFDIPENWEWTKISNILSAFSGVSYPKEALSVKSDNMIRVLRGGNIYNMNYLFKDDDIMLSSEFVKPELFLKENCLITPAVTSLQHIGKIALIDRNFTDVTAGGFVLILEPYYLEKMFSKYLLFVMNSQYHRENLRNITNKSGQAFYNVSRNKMMDLLIPIPPQAEQQRIVAKVESLMSEIDKLEQLLQKKEHLMELLPKAVVDAIGKCQTGEELKEQLQYVIDNFETVFQTPGSMQELRNVVLQLAIEGKLVPQDPNDESASELLNEIKAEKDKLVKEGKIKKQKLPEPIKDSEIPFGIPNSWSWIRLDEISSLITKGSSPKWQGISYTDKEEVLFITSENVGNNKLLLDKKKYVEKKFNEIEPRSILSKNDILMNIVGASIGRTAIYNLEDIANINQAVCLIRVFYNQINLNYLLSFLNSRTCIGYMYDKQVDNARANLSMSNIAKFLIPLPPIKEQYRIVQKVELIMILIDQMENMVKHKVDLVEKMVST